MFALIPKNNASGNFIKVPALVPVRISFTGLPEAEFQLLPGMSAEVRIDVADKAKKSKTHSDETKATTSKSTGADTDQKKPPEEKRGQSGMDKTTPAKSKESDAPTPAQPPGTEAGKPDSGKGD